MFGLGLFPNVTASSANDRGWELGYLADAILGHDLITMAEPVDDLRIKSYVFQMVDDGGQIGQDRSRICCITLVKSGMAQQGIQGSPDIFGNIILSFSFNSDCKIGKSGVNVFHIGQLVGSQRKIGKNLHK